MDKRDTLNEVSYVSDLRDMLNKSTEKFPDKAAFKVKRDKEYIDITYREFKKDVESLGEALLELGLKDKYIAVIGENRYEWCTTYLAVANGLGVIVPLDKELNSEEISYIVNTSDAAAIIYSANYKEKLSNIRAQKKDVIFINMDATEDNEEGLSYKKLLNKGNTLLDKGSKEYRGLSIDPDEMRVLLFTSGTTDIAKGVMLCHRNLAFEVMNICKTVTANENTRVLSILPMHHTYECTCGFLTIIYVGGCLGFCEGLKYIAQNIREIKPTFLVVVPLILENIYSKIIAEACKTPGLKLKFKFGVTVSEILRKVFKKDIRKKLFDKVHANFGGCLETFICGASALAPHVSKGFDQMGIRVLQGYGLTECAPIVTGNREDWYKYAAIGLPLPGVEVKIDSPDNKGIGEILTKGPNVMLGYFKNEEATNNVFEDGWFKTGDYGRVDKDGFYYITGRKKNLIITKTGKNIFPEELEQKLNESPFVLESLVTGQKDKETGEDFVHASIVPKIEIIKEKLNLKNITESDAIKVIKEEVKKINITLPVYKKIKDFSIQFEEFEKTTTKKIKRHKNK